MKPLIGIDLDNTVVIYDDLFYSLACEQGLIAPGVKKNKTVVRDLIRGLPEGEFKWQELQGVVYGEQMHRACLADGFDCFVESSRAKGLGLVIVSHKTEFGHFAEKRINLREAALDFMRKKGFFDSAGFGFSEHEVFFESSRQEKINRLCELHCECFIDDLIELFEEASFPQGVRKILYAPHGCKKVDPTIKMCSHWGEITESVLSS